MKYPGKETVLNVVELTLWGNGCVFFVDADCGGMATTEGEDEQGQFIAGIATQEHADALFDLLEATIKQYAADHPGAMTTYHDPAEYVSDDAP